METTATDSIGGGSGSDVSPSGDVVTQTKALVDKAASSAKERVRSSAASGKDMVADTVSCLAQSLTSASQQLKSQHNSASGLVEHAAQRLDRVARQLDNSRVEELVDRGERWARENPALFLGSVFVVGVLAGRFLKASQPTLQSESRPSTFSDREVPLLVEGA